MKYSTLPRTSDRWRISAPKEMSECIHYIYVIRKPMPFKLKEVYRHWHMWLRRQARHSNRKIR
jgi:hypothetical protein